MSLVLPASAGDLHSRYTVGEQIGRGTFAVVRKAQSRDSSENVAVKEVSKDKLDEPTRRLLQNEYRSLEEVSRHPGIVTLREAFETDSSLYFVLDLISGGPLLDKIVDLGSFSEDDARITIATVLRTLSFMSQLGVVHRDIKPENLLVDPHSAQWPLKLTDFGLSAKIQNKERLYDICGTPYFIAPEVLVGAGYGSSCDMWSIGIVLYIILCGYPPFFCEDSKQLFASICAGNFAFPEAEWDRVSEEAKFVVARMLHRDPDSRVTPDEALTLPWFKKAQSKAQLPNSNLKNFNARRKMKGSMLAVRAGFDFLSLVKTPSLAVPGLDQARSGTLALPKLSRTEAEQITEATRRFVSDNDDADAKPEFLSFSSEKGRSASTHPPLKSLLFGAGVASEATQTGRPELPGSGAYEPESIVDSGKRLSGSGRIPLQALLNEYNPEEFSRKVGLLLTTIANFYSLLDKEEGQSPFWEGGTSEQDGGASSILRRMKTATSMAKVMPAMQSQEGPEEGQAGWNTLKRGFSIGTSGGGLGRGEPRELPSSREQKPPPSDASSKEAPRSRLRPKLKPLNMGLLGSDQNSDLSSSTGAGAESSTSLGDDTNELEKTRSSPESSSVPKK